MRNKKNSKDRICEEIKRRISHYVYKPGDILRENDLMEEFEMGRTPVREAFIQLSSTGLIEMIPNQGTFVRKVSFGELMQVYEVRAHLIELSGSLAAQRICEKQIEQMEEILHEAGGVADREGILALDARMHVLIDAATRNEELARILDNLKIKFLSIWEYPVDNPRYYQSMYDDFVALVEALKGREGEKCGQIMRQHLQRAFRQFEGIL